MPVVAVFGVRPVVPKLMLATPLPPPAGACETQAVPFEVRTLPFVPAEITPVPPDAGGRGEVNPVIVPPVIDTLAKAFVPFPIPLIPSRKVVRSASRFDSGIAVVALANV
jgi:hypothetical protein